MTHRTLIFIHVPKTAGTTLRRIIAAQCERGRPLVADGYDLDGVIDRLRSLDPGERARIDAVVGHIPFGIHEHLPGPCRYVTMLREPVDRIVSHYRYVLRDPTTRPHQEVAGEGMSITDYVTRSRYADVFNDGQVRLLGGAFGPEGRATPRMLELAKERLETWFEVVGLTERFDESILLMMDAFGWGWPVYEPLKVAGPRPGPDEVPEDVVGLIRERNALDLELYRWASERFERRVAAAGDAFRAGVELFRVLNERAPRPRPR